MACPKYRDERCSAAGTLAILSEPWSPLIIQDALFNGTTRFSDFQFHLNIAPNIIALRLSNFVEAGLMEVREDPEDATAHAYVLTQKGTDLAPSLIAFATWGDRWTSEEEPSLDLEHYGCGGALELVIRCVTCGESPSPELVAPGSELDLEVLTAALHTDPPGDTPDADAMRPEVNVRLLGTFAISIDGEAVAPLAAGTQRLLAYLALQDDSVTRISMAGTMWPEVSDQSAGGSLRSALSRLDQPTRDAILTGSGGIGLEQAVEVDLRVARSLANRLIEQNATVVDSDLNEAAVAMLSLDLLPGWYEDWVVAEAEAWKVLRRNALEVQAGYLSARDRWSEAAGAARVAVNIDPLRESPQACLVKVHLAQGNQSEALNVYNAYKDLLMAEIGIEPSTHITTLVSDILR